MNGEHEARVKSQERVFMVKAMLLLFAELLLGWWLVTHDAMYTPVLNLTAFFIAIGFIPYQAYRALERLCE